MIHHWKVFDLEITGSEYHHDPTSYVKLNFLKHQTLNM